MLRDDGFRGGICPGRSAEVAAESSGVESEGGERKADEEHDPDREGDRGTPDEFGRELAPHPRRVRVDAEVGRPEDCVAEDRKERRQKSHTGDEHHRDSDREWNPEILVDAEAREQEAEKGEDHGPGGGTDRLTDSDEGVFDRSLRLETARISSRTRKTRKSP